MFTAPPQRSSFPGVQTGSSRAKFFRTATDHVHASIRSCQKSSANLSGNSSHHIVSLIENHAMEVGLCALNLSSFKFELITFRDTQNYSTALSVVTCYDPVEFLVSQTQLDNFILKKFAKEFSKTPISAISNILFKSKHQKLNGSLGFEFI